MSSRMDRYDVPEKNKSSRLSKNKKLYEDLYTNSSYTEFTDINSSNVIELNNNLSNTIGRRENYQKNKEYSNAFNTDDIYKYDPFDEEKYSLETESISKKDYDINSVLESAKKNRVDVDDLEKKRKLRTTEYDILKDLTEEKLKEHKEKKKEVLSKEEEEELKDLIYTITSNTMRQDIDNELLSGLMPTKLDETVVSSDLSEELNATINIDDIVNNNEDTTNISTTSTSLKLDDSFYTKSMDLSDQDLVKNVEKDEEEYFEDFDDKKNGVMEILVVVGSLVLIIAIGIVIYKVIIGG